MTGILPYKEMMPRLGRDVFIAPGAWVIGDVVIGDRSSIWFNVVVRGDVHYIRIGMETNVQDNSVLHVAQHQFPLEIGDRVTIGHRTIVHGCVVEDDCLIGMGAIILDGAKIGSGSLVAAGSVVTPGLVAPPGSVLMGVPAIVKESVSEAERARIRDGAQEYVQLAADYAAPQFLHKEKTVRGFLG